MINWLKLALTKVRASGMSVLATAEPAAVMGDEILFDHRNTMLEADLKGLKVAATSGITEGLGRLADLQQDLVDEAKLARKASSKSNKATITDKFGHRVVNLMQLCGIGKEEDLPQVWE